jgi:hypothetical protein
LSDRKRLTMPPQAVWAPPHHDRRTRPTTCVRHPILVCQTCRGMGRAQQARQARALAHQGAVESKWSRIDAGRNGTPVRCGACGHRRGVPGSSGDGGRGRDRARWGRRNRGRARGRWGLERSPRDAYAGRRLTTIDTRGVNAERVARPPRRNPSATFGATTRPSIKRAGSSDPVARLH